jgi:hypothetical protein
VPRIAVPAPLRRRRAWPSGPPFGFLIGASVNPVVPRRPKDAIVDYFADSVGPFGAGRSLGGAGTASGPASCAPPAQTPRHYEITVMSRRTRQYHPPGPNLLVHSFLLANEQLAILARRPAKSGSELLGYLP